MHIQFREYKQEDKDLLFTFTKKLEDHDRSVDPLGRIKHLPGFSEASLEETLENVKKYQGKIWFVEDEGTVIGYIIGVIWEQSEINRLEIGPHTLGQVIDMYLEEAYRGKGIGKTMLQKMEDYFKEKGCDSMWISTSTSNETARSTYKKYGFIEREIGMLKTI